MSNISKQAIITTILGLLVIGLAFWGSKKLESNKKAPQKKAVKKEAVRTVDVFEIQNQTVENRIPIQGQLVAFEKVDLFSEVGGKLTSLGKPFKKGIRFNAGEPLFTIDQQVQTYSLKAQKSALLNAITTFLPDLKIDYPESFEPWREYVRKFNVDRPIAAFPTPATEREKLFIAGRNIQNTYYSIKSAEEQLKKYSPIAPFDGVLTEASINEGAVISPGQRLGQLMNPNSYELEAPIPLSELKYLKVGNKVSLKSSSIDGNWSGTIQRINSQIDNQTQAVTVFIRVRGNGLREGMYLSGEALGKSFASGQEIPISALTDNSGIYVIKDSTLVFTEVEPVKSFANSVLIDDLPDNTLILAKKFPAAYDGMKVNIGKTVNK